MKRLARLAIRAPPAGAMTCVAFVHNMLRRHPGLGVLVHREEKKQPGGGGDDANGRARASPLFSEDPFDDLEPDPSASRALESSLWEMDALRSHYNPQVAKLTQVLERDLGDRAKTAEVPIGDLCVATYGSLAREELAARVKSAATTHRGRMVMCWKGMRSRHSCTWSQQCGTFALPALKRGISFTDCSHIGR